MRRTPQERLLHSVRLFLNSVLVNSVNFYKAGPLTYRGVICGGGGGGQGVSHSVCISLTPSQTLPEEIEVGLSWYPWRFRHFSHNPLHDRVLSNVVGIIHTLIPTMWDATVESILSLVSPFTTVCVIIGLRVTRRLPKASQDPMRKANQSKKRRRRKRRHLKRKERVLNQVRASLLKRKQKLR